MTVIVGLALVAGGLTGLVGFLLRPRLGVVFWLVMCIAVLIGVVMGYLVVNVFIQINEWT